MRMQFLKFLIPCLIFSQEVDIVKYGVFEPSVIILIEKKVQEGIITREDADNRYLNFLKTNTNKTKNNESVINNHFKKIGVDDLNQLRNEFLKRKFPVEQIEATLGGMLRLIHAMKKQQHAYQISPRLESYFKDRLGLKKSHINYIITKSKKLARIR